MKILTLAILAVLAGCKDREEAPPPPSGDAGRRDAGRDASGGDASAEDASSEDASSEACEAIPVSTLLVEGTLEEGEPPAPTYGIPTAGSYHLVARASYNGSATPGPSYGALRVTLHEESFELDFHSTEPTGTYELLYSVNVLLGDGTGVPETVVVTCLDPAGSGGPGTDITTGVSYSATETGFSWATNQAEGAVALATYELDE